MRTKFPIQRRCRIYLFKGPELSTGYVGFEMNIAKTGEWRKHPWYNGSSKVLKGLIEKYGRSRFIKKILKEFPFENKFKTGKIESFYIHKYNTLHPNGINRYDPGIRPGFNMAGCFNSEETKQKMSKVRKEAWKNPEYAEKMKQQSIKLWKDVEFIEKQIKKTIVQWENPEIREKMTKAQNKPETKRKKSLFMIEKWKDSEYRESLFVASKNREKKECEYCGKVVALCHYAYWHRNNCKYKPKMRRTA